MQKTTIEISTIAILKIFGIALGLWLLWYLRNVIIILFVVALLVAAFSPTVERLYKKKVPRILSVLLIYLGVALLFALMIYLIVPPVTLQIKEFTHNLPVFIEKASPIYSQFKEYLPAFQQSLEHITSTLNKLTTNLWSAALTLFGGLISFVTILVLTFYILIGKESIESVLISFLPWDHKDRIIRVFQRVGKKIGAWVRGQLILCLIIALATSIILAILRVPYALILAILAGMLEIIPTIGPILSAIPAILLALTISPMTAFIVAICYLGVQQLESQILVPKIMGKAVGLSPVIVIIALLVGAKLFGIAGAVLAIPIAAAIQVLVSELRSERVRE
jgi:predicted PurR-regulated permease PerM